MEIIAPIPSIELYSQLNFWKLNELTPQFNIIATIKTKVHQKKILNQKYPLLLPFKFILTKHILICFFNLFPFI